jgi:hypothetical protein
VHCLTLPTPHNSEHKGINDIPRLAPGCVNLGRDAYALEQRAPLRQ